MCGRIDKPVLITTSYVNDMKLNIYYRNYVVSRPVIKIVTQVIIIIEIVFLIISCYCIINSKQLEAMNRLEVKIGVRVNECQRVNGNVLYSVSKINYVLCIENANN